MIRFLRYSMEHGRKIRAVFMLEGRLVQKTVQVLAFDDATVLLQAGKKTVSVPLGEVFSCDYARGDSGEE